jgi:Flp pilus assembly protein TadD
VASKAIEFRFGSGEHSKSYFGRDAAGNLVELPVSWYAGSGEGFWEMSPGFAGAQHAGFSRRVNPQCLFCHNAYPSPGDTQVRAVGIDCQRCHGPGAVHAANPNRSTIVNPARLSRARGMDVCLQCHLETTNLQLPGKIIRYDRDVFSYRPGEALSDYELFFDHAPGTGYDDKFEFSSAPYRLFQSACYRANPEAMTCTTCHDPHGGERTPASYAKVCGTCHPTATLTTSRHPPGADCVSCHMARRNPEDAVHVTVTDHLIRKTIAPPAKSAAVEYNSLNRPAYRDKVVPYYPKDGAAVLDYDLYLGAAQVRDQSNLAGGIPLLEAAIARLQPKVAGPYLDLADALRRTGQSSAAAERYRQAIALEEGNWRAHYGLALVDPAASLPALARAQVLAPAEPAIYQAAAGIRTAANQHTEAVAILRAGIKAVPDSSELYNNLGTALLRTNAVKEAESAFREAVRLRPELAAVRLNLAMLLARTSRLAESDFEFAAALKLDPSSAEAHSGYGTSLAARSRLSEAKQQFEEALRLNPRLANTHNNLGIVLKRLGDSAGALREFRTAVDLDSGLAAARKNLEDSLAGR